VSLPGPTTHLRALLFRAHHPGWAFAPDSGDGARRHGGRFNPRGLPALYTATRLQTGWAEAQQGSPFKAQPMTIIAYRADCAAVADLTDPAVLAAWGIAPAALGCAWKDLADRGEDPPSWALARRLAAEGCAGALVPSFATGAGPQDVNAVFWRWGADPPHRLQVVDDFGRLPRDRRSWR
jgi:RES domain-containing protein